MKIKILLLLIIISNNSFSQCFTKAISEGNKGIDDFSGMSNDKYGNIYIIGNIQHTTILGQGSYAQTLENGGNFIAKYDDNLNLTWLKKMPYRISAIATDSVGNSYLTGNYCNTAWPYNSNPYLTCMDIFIIKLDSAGNQLWFRSDGGPHSEYVNAIAIDQEGNCYITGNFLWKTYFGNDTVVVSPMVDDNTFSFVAAYDKNGNYKWIRAKGLKYFDEGKAITVNSDGEIIVVSNFSIIQNGLFIGKQLNISKYLPDGTEVWEINEMSTGTYAYYSSGFITDDENNIYLCGNFINICEFGGQSHTSTDFWDMFLIKYNNDGIFQNILLSGGENFQGGIAMCLINNGNIGLSIGYSNELQIDGQISKGKKNAIAILDNNLKLISLTEIIPSNSGGVRILKFNSDNNKIFGGGLFNFSMTLPTEKDNIILNVVEFDHGNYISKWEDLFLAIFDPECETTTDIEGTKTTSGFTIYPNPARSSFTIHYQSVQTGQVNIKVKTLTGAVIYEATENNGSGTFQKQIDLGKKAQGVYFVELVWDKERMVKKMIVGK